MKLLLDENLPHRLRPLLTGHNIYPVAYMKWKGIENGELLRLAANNDFDAVRTKDTGIPYEQNVAALPCSLIVLLAASNALDDIKPLVPEILARLKTLTPKSVAYIGSR